MGDHFEEALVSIARRRNGGAKTVDDLFDLAVAGNRDAEERHNRSVIAIRSNSELLAAHCTEADIRDAAIAELQEWRRDQTSNCAARVKAMIEEEHAARHLAYVSELGEGDFRSRLVWFFASGFGKFALVLLGLIAGLLLNLAVYGRP